MTEQLHDLQGNEIAALLVPTAVTLVTARDETGADKVATIAWTMPISHEPSLMAVSIRPGGQTSNAMKQSGCFVINVLDAASARAAVICGTKQGIDDRIASAQLELDDAREVDASRVEGALSWIECEFVESTVYGDHELFIGRTVCAQTRGALDERGKLVAQPVLLMGQRGCFGHFEEDA